MSKVASSASFASRHSDQVCNDLRVNAVPLGELHNKLFDDREQQLKSSGAHFHIAVWRGAILGSLFAAMAVAGILSFMIWLKLRFAIDILIARFMLTAAPVLKHWR